MAERLHYLPGTRAILVYVDEEGTSRSSIIEVVKKRMLRGHAFYEVKAPKHALNSVEHLMPFAIGTNLEKGWTVGMVRASLLRPLGTRSFQIVHRGETQ